MRRALAFGFACALGLGAASASAQCGAKTTSCRQCHEVDEGGVRPANQPWHTDHAVGDFCVDCHGGNGETRDLATTHASLTDPLTSSPSRCLACHADAAPRAARYATVRQESVRRSPSPPAAAPTSPPAGPHGGGPANAVLASLVAALGVALGVVASRRVRSGVGAPRPLRKLFAAPEWSPHLAGALLGVVAAVSMAAFGRRLSGGGAYQQMVGPIGRAVAPGSVYFGRVLAGSARWELAAFGGALLGAFVSARLGGTFRLRTMPDGDGEQTFGTSILRRWTTGFLGAALAEFASGIAGGCTASLAVSGGATLSPGAFVFMAAMFAGGIPTAWLLYGRARR